MRRIGMSVHSQGPGCREPRRAVVGIRLVRDDASWSRAIKSARQNHTMRSFLVACLVAALVAVGAAYLLDTFVQETASAAFSTEATRI